MRIPGVAIGHGPSGQSPSGPRRKTWLMSKIGKEPAAMQGAMTQPLAATSSLDPIPPPGPRSSPDLAELGRQRIVVSIATYNERDNLGDLVAAIHAELP